MAMNQDNVLRRLLDERPMLTGFIWSIVRDHHVAEDVYQETMIRATHCSEPFDDAGHLLNWARKTARHLAIDHLRTMQRRPLVLDADVLDRLDDAWGERGGAATDELRDALTHCMSELTQRTRRMIEMRFAESMSVGQIAEAFDRKPETMYQAFFRAYQKLNTCITTRLNLYGGRA